MSNINNKEIHPVYEIKETIKRLYMYRYRLIKNMYDSDISPGYMLIARNNKHYEEIINSMKKLIKIIKNIKKYNLNIDCNVELSEYEYYYNNNDDFYNFNMYKDKENKICESLYFGINNFIYYIICILKNLEMENVSYLLKLLQIYKIIDHNLTIVNRTLDRPFMKYYIQKNYKYININKKLLLNINITFNKKYKTIIENVKEDDMNRVIFNTVIIDFFNVNNSVITFLPDNIIIINDVDHNINENVIKVKIHNKNSINNNNYKYMITYIRRYIKKINKKYKYIDKYVNTNIKNEVIHKDINKYIDDDIPNKLINKMKKWYINKLCIKNISRIVKYTIINYKKRKDELIM